VTRNKYLTARPGGPAGWSARRVAALVAAGEIFPGAAARACLARVDAIDGDVRAFLETADPDQFPVTGAPTPGPLAGVPVAVKDTINVAGFRTTFNSPLYTDFRPSRDAACVTLLRAAGATVIGKTDTVEFAAAGRNAQTRNPHDLGRSPGGSSNGSAAAVAAWMAPIAIGTQTGGSMIRPAAYCGVYAMKPSWGRVGLAGTRVNVPSLDCVGWFARDVEDLELVAQVMGLGEVATDIEPGSLRIGLCRTPEWSFAETPMRRALADVGRHLAAAGVTVEPVTLPRSFRGLAWAVADIMAGESRAAFALEAAIGGTLLHADFKARVDDTDGIMPDRLLRAWDLVADCRRRAARLFENFDALVAPSAPGSAIPFDHGPGDPVFNLLWSGLHVPLLNIPCAPRPDELPLGVTLAGPRLADMRLLAIARAVAPAIAGVQ
jgi:Asp-tRNA(Asn)/Glu-tRNA(Gln) amidotransferase A subunit family amidase